jgi:hypothetical protein
MNDVACSLCEFLIAKLPETAGVFLPRLVDDHGIGHHTVLMDEAMGRFDIPQMCVDLKSEGRSK